MPNANQAVRFIGCTFASYSALGIYNQNTLYFCTDTQQIFLGDREYTKSIKVLDAQPTASTVGEHGRMYVYNGNLYMCQISGYSYVWTRIANVNDDNGTVTSVKAGSGLDGGTITESGTISHAVPTGASAKSDVVIGASPAFGGSFQVAGVQTDEFGHVVSVNLHTITLPTETEISVSSKDSGAENLEEEDIFNAVVAMTKGPGTHEISYETKTFKLPKTSDTTFTISTGEASGSVKITGSNGSVTEAVVKDWEQLAKVTDITSIFHYKGKLSKVADLPATAATGDVWYVEEDSTEYVYLGEDKGWEEFGPTVDLSAYAKSVDVIPRVTGKTGEVPVFAEDGTLASSGHTIEKDVPADAQFTDTKYTHATHTPHGLGLYKVQVDGEGHVSSASQVEKADIVGLGLPAENTDKNVKTNPNTTSKIYLAGTGTSDESTGELQVNPNAFINADGSISATGFHGKTDSAASADTAEVADKAKADAEGNNIKDTYATKQEVKDSTTVWEVI